MAKRKNNEETFDVIRRHLFDEGEELVPLNDFEKKKLQIWNYAIELRTCDQLRTKAIVQKLMEKFDIERATAFNDIGNAERLFGYSMTINIRCRTGGRIEF